MRTERAHLQYEVDVLAQRLTQDTLNLKDDLKGMLDDRKMAVRMEQRNMESKIHELNYAINVTLGSDSRGKVEGLRWFLSRRAALFIASMGSEWLTDFSTTYPKHTDGLVVLILGSLRYSAHMTHLAQIERQKMQEEQKRAEKAMRSSAGGNYTVPARSMSTQTGDNTDTVLSSMDHGTSTSFVTLG